MQITSQTELEILFSKYQLFKAIAAEFMEESITTQIDAAGISIKFGIDLLVQMVLHRRANLPTLIGLLRKHFEEGETQLQTCANMLIKAAEADLVDWDDKAQIFVMRYDISQDVKDKLDLYQYPLPMVEEPRKVKHNRETGYITIQGSLILKDNHHDDDICLDHINRVNAVPLALDPDVVAFIKNQWKHIDKRQPGEPMHVFRERRKAFQKYDTVSRDVIDALLEQGDRFWLTHKYDKRGRTYAQGYHVNYQGNDWNKACVQFADKEMVR